MLERHSVEAPAGKSDKSVALIGNGSSVLQDRLGAVIDGHEVVARCNLFQIQGYEEHVGTRTTHWFCNRDASPHLIKSMLRRHAFDHVYVHTWGRTEQAAQSFRDELNRLERRAEVLAIPKKWIDEMRAFLGRDYRMFSTGAIAAWVLLKQYALVRLYGFDWWQSPGRHHYCDKQTFEYNPVGGHQPLLEKEFFNKLKAIDRLILNF